MVTVTEAVAATSKEAATATHVFGCKAGCIGAQYRCPLTCPVCVRKEKGLKRAFTRWLVRADVNITQTNYTMTRRMRARLTPAEHGVVWRSVVECGAVWRSVAKCIRIPYSYHARPAGWRFSQHAALAIRPHQALEHIWRSALRLRNASIHA
eukprot:14275-Chlamydomonas_euryale.AAC.3